MTPVVAGPSLGMALLVLAVAIAFVRHRAGLGLATGATLTVWGIQWFLVPPLEVLGPLAVQADGPGLTAAVGAVTGCALGRGRARAGMAACLLGACLVADVRLGLSLLGLAWIAAAWVHGGPSRLMIGALFVGTAMIGAWWFGARFDDLPQLRSIVQIRLLGGYGAVLIAVLILPGAARTAGLLAWTWGLMRFVAPLCPEAVQLIAPGLRWLAVALAALGAALVCLRRPDASIALVACAGAWLGLETGTDLGIGGAALLLAAGAVGTPLVQRDGRLGTLAAFASPATIAGLLWVVHASRTAVGPVALGGWSFAVAGAALVALLAGVFGARRPLEGARGFALGAAVAAVLGAAPLVAQSMPGAEGVAAQVGRRGIPPDDRFGWRRVQWLERFRPQPPADAGVE